MSGYLIAHFSITDEEGYGRYVEATIPLLEAHKAKLLVADDAATVLEGEYSDGRLVIVEFPSLEEARRGMSRQNIRRLSQSGKRRLAPTR